MNKFKKILVICLAVIILAFIILYPIIRNSRSASNDYSNNENSVALDRTEKEEITIDFSKVEISMIFPQKVGYKWSYTGTLDYGVGEELTDIIQNDSGQTIIIKGEYYSLADEPEENNFYTVKYTVTEDSIITSDGYVCLKTPFEVGSSWNSKYTLDGKQYDATTTISKLKGNYIITEMIIPNMNDYKNKRYYRKTVYKVGGWEIYCGYSVPIASGGFIFHYRTDEADEHMDEFSGKEE